MKIIKKCFVLLTFIMLFATLSSCSLPSLEKNHITNEITNNVVNDITQKITTYDELISIDSLEKAVKLAVAKCEKSVVVIKVKKIVDAVVKGQNVIYEDYESLGSAVIYKREAEYDDEEKLINYTYYAYTNAHVVTSKEEGVHSIYACFGYEEKDARATIVGIDKKLDLACIKFQSYNYYPEVEIGSCSDLEKGEFVIAIGCPNNYEYYGTATFGILSNLNRYLSFDTDEDGTNDYVSEYIQTDAAVNPGNSGGGLFTLDGKLIGINSIKIASVKVENMGFAIPVDLVKAAVDNYLSKGLEIVRPKLGVTTLPVKELRSAYLIEKEITSLPNIYLDGNSYGLFIDSVEKNSCLDKYGLKANDIILSFDGIQLYSTSDLSGRLNSIDKYCVGDKVTLEYYNNSLDKIETIEIILEAPSK